MTHFLARSRSVRTFGITFVASLAALFSASPVDARITRIEIDAARSQSPTFGGFSWPNVGQYEKIVGKAFGEVNPHDRRNRVIVDIEFAPRNARGNVEYAFNFYILKPIDLSRGARKMMYEPPNRGGKTWAALGRVTVDPGGNGDDPGSAITNPTVLANSFLMPRGYAIAWSDPAATLDKTHATLTHRVHLNDAPQVIPASGWNYNAAGTAISLAGGSFVANDIYEFAYTAKDPKVAGLGFAAVRDWNAWLRYEKRDDLGNPNPLAGHIKRIYTEISSQPGRLLNDFRNLGFNEAENGKKVFDGHMQWIAAANGINMNYRFSQSGRTERNRQNHLYIEGRFPFANVMTHDPITRKTDSRYASCQETKTCPLGVEIYSANEYWVKSASLLHTDPTGSHDLHDSKYTRNYFMSSMRHGTAASPNGPGTLPSSGLCQQADNPLNSAPVQRALFIALDQWATEDRNPPHSRVPKLRDGTLAPPLPQSEMGFPNIPSPFADGPGPLVTYTGLKTTRYHFDYGLNFYETGIATVNPPLFPFTTPSYQDDARNGPIYPSFIPKTDGDGNDIAGVRLADVTVPLATYTGWALRRGAQADDGCEANGQFIPFATDETKRGSDPRPSVAFRYPTFAAYHAKVRNALDDMVSDRLLLCEDAGSEEARLMQAGITRGVLPPEGGVLPVVEPLRACREDEHEHGHGHHHDHDRDHRDHDDDD